MADTTQYTLEVRLNAETDHYEIGIVYEGAWLPIEAFQTSFVVERIARAAEAAAAAEPASKSK
jgi:hypothetical protein